MKKLFLVALCSTSFLSFARAEGAGGGMGQGDAMQHADAMKPDATQAPSPPAKQVKKEAKKQDDASKMKHGGMDHGSMKHEGQMDHGAMKHEGQMDHGAMQHEGQMDGGTK